MAAISRPPRQKYIQTTSAPALGRVATEYTKGMRILFESGAFSDFTIICKGKEFKVHKSVICMQSEYFRKACTSAFKEAAKSRLKLKEIDPKIVQGILQYLYTEQYDPQTFGGQKCSPLHFHIRMMIAAEMFMLNQLYYEAMSNFQNTYLHQNPSVGRKDLEKVIKTTYKATQAGSPIRKEVLSVIYCCRMALFGEGSDGENFVELTRSIPEVAMNLVQIYQAVVQEKMFDHAYLCKTCDRWTLDKEICPGCSHRAASKATQPDQSTNGSIIETSPEQVEVTRHGD